MLDTLSVSYRSFWDWQSLGTSLAHHGPIFCISWTYMGHILGINWVYPGLWVFFLGISGHIMGISCTYLWYILGIYWVYQEHILSILGHILKIVFQNISYYLAHLLSIISIFSSVRSSYSHLDLLLTHHHHHPTFSDHSGSQHWTFTFWATTAI